MRRGVAPPDAETDHCTTVVRIDASFHPRQIPPFLSFCWTVAARTYLRQLAIRQLKGMPPVHLGDASLGNGHNGGTPTLEDEVRHLTQIVTSIIARLEHFRTPVGRESYFIPKRGTGRR